MPKETDVLRIKTISTLIIFSILLVACSEEDKRTTEGANEETTLESYTFSLDGQDFEIIPFYDDVLSYTKSMNENDDLKNKEAYTKYVVEPFKEKTNLDNGELGSPLSQTSDHEKLAENTLKLKKSHKEMYQWIEEALTESAKQLPGQDTKVYVFPVNPEDHFTVDQLEGIAGEAFFGNHILLQIDPSVSEEMFKYTVAHEYHHTVYFSLNYDQITSSVIESILTEGKADTFAKIIYPEADINWIEPLLEEEEIDVLSELNKNAQSTDWKIHEGFRQGNRAKGLPRWSNYKIGYQIMDDYLENNPDVSMIDWTKKTAKQIVNGSSYSEMFN